MDRCALFVDAGHVLADGAMAVHGTRRRESVSWDYAGLLQLLGGMAKEQSGLPLLRCYWYEATVEGRRSAEHDELADLPGVKLRLAKMRPGHREGVEGEIHRDLTTLARNKAVSEAIIVSAEEDLAEVVADVQDLGMRVTLLHVAFDGNGTIPRALRQECDDVADISSEHLRPYVELISGAEPPRADEQDGASLIAFRPAVNGHGQPGDTAAQPPAAQLSRSQPADPAADFLLGLAAKPASIPVGAAQRPDPAWEQQDAQPAEQETQPSHQNAQWGQRDIVAEQDQAAASLEPAVSAAPQFVGAPPDLALLQPEQARVEPPPQQDYGAPSGVPSRPAGFVTRQDGYGAPMALPAPHDQQLGARPPAAADISGYNPGAMREQSPVGAVSRESPGGGFRTVPDEPGSAQVRRLPVRGTGSQPAVPSGVSAPTAGPPPAPAAAHPMPVPPRIVQPEGVQPVSGQSLPSPVPGYAGAGAAQPEGVHTGMHAKPGSPGTGYASARGGSYSGPRPVAPVAPVAPVGSGGPGGPSGLVAPAGAPQAAPGGQPGPGLGAPGMPVPVGSPAGTMNGNGIGQTAYGPATAGFGGSGVPGLPGTPGGSGAPLGPIGPAGPAGPGYSGGGQPGVSLADAVQSAHREGQEFGESVARDAPALWLEAVLARKPRMPSDLEARLLQGSALPIDFLLHDEVRHALRRGFWDALERARR